MKKNIFAVCDLEVDYAFNFMDYLNQKRNLPFEIQAFTTAESLLAYGKENHIELLLISDKAMRKEIREIGIGKIIILSEGVHPPELDQYSSVSVFLHFGRLPCRYTAPSYVRCISPK